MSPTWAHSLVRKRGESLTGLDSPETNASGAKPLSGERAEPETLR